MRLLCEFESTQYVACEEVLVALNPSTGGTIKQYVFLSGKGSQITAVTVSNDGKYVYAGYANKYICCWDTTNNEVIGSVLHSKRPTALVFTTTNATPNNELKDVLVVSDKAGLIWGMDIPFFHKQVLLAGHTASVITDMATDGTYIATADRDEKIRISSFPRLDTIKSFCLAHTNVVTSINFIKIDNLYFMLSCGWDHKVCLWNHIDGSILDVVLYESLSAATENENNLMENTTTPVTTSDSPENIKTSTTDSTSEMTQIEVGKEGEIGGDAVEDFTEKTYDENDAGYYPLKVVASPNASLVAVIFKNKNCVKIYHIEKTDKTHNIENGNEEKKVKYSFGKETIKETLSVPCDISFSVQNELLILLSKPYYIQILQINVNNTNSTNNLDVKNDRLQILDYSDKTKKSAIITSFQEICISLKINFSQQLVSTEDGVDAEKGIRKHALDRPFGKETGIDPEKKSGTKRSRRRAGFEIREKEKDDRLKELKKNKEGNIDSENENLEEKKVEKEE